MRKILISLLMAGVAVVPSIAQAQDSGAERRAERRAARQQAQSSSNDRSSSRDERAAQREERAAQREEQRQGRQNSVQASDSNQVAIAGNDDPRRGGRDRAGHQSQQAMDAGVVDPARDARQQQRLDRRGARQDQVSERREDRQARYAAMREARRNAPPPVVSSTPRPNSQPPLPRVSRPTYQPHWNTSWRNNSRYNWHNYRRKHHWLFNLGFYNDPFGWGYSPMSIGWRMWPSYYGSRYWLNDPWQYRLPYAPPGTRWVRYYDDAVLVDTWSGQVLDVIYDFFW